jgi:hypothetical protein
MKKILIATLSTLISTICFAGPSSQGPGNQPDALTSIVDWNKTPRVLFFDHFANNISVNGEIFVCNVETKTAECKDDKGMNRWQLLETVTIPQYELKSYQYHYVGSSGRRILHVYFSKKK